MAVKFIREIVVSSLATALVTAVYTHGPDLKAIGALTSATPAAPAAERDQGRESRAVPGAHRLGACRKILAPLGHRREDPGRQYGVGGRRARLAAAGQRRRKIRSRERQDRRVEVRAAGRGRRAAGLAARRGRSGEGCAAAGCGGRCGEQAGACAGSARRLRPRPHRRPMRRASPTSSRIMSGIPALWSSAACPVAFRR